MPAVEAAMRAVEASMPAVEAVMPAVEVAMQAVEVAMPSHMNDKTEKLKNHYMVFLFFSIKQNHFKPSST
jgi:phosphoribosyl-AMP cyclohydrolase